MANVFDFQLKADDQVSQSIQNIDDAVKKLTPHLNDAQKVVQLGGAVLQKDWMKSVDASRSWQKMRGTACSLSGTSYRR